ncbi:MAG: hypothetical protein H7Y43_17785 [Akkermansiaceae bacterium]|nr:hypothetical protein [Verrucomicrobiales bacterium]
MKIFLLLLSSLASVNAALVVYPIGDAAYRLNRQQVLVLDVTLHLEGTAKEVSRQLDFYRRSDYRLNSYQRMVTNKVVSINANYEIPLGRRRVTSK